MPATIAKYTADTLPIELAKHIISIQDHVLKQKDRFDVAISGGSLAKTMAKGLVGNPHAKLSKWNIWLADERIVKNDDADSNFGVFVTDFLAGIPESERPRTFPLDDSLPIDSTPSATFAEDYQNRLIKELGPSPKLDLVLLGMGPDGHTCSLFPGHQLLEEGELWIASLDDSPKPPPRRITLTKRALANAEHLAFVAAGSPKTEALKGVFLRRDPALPSFQVNELAKHEVVWFSDPAAVGDINLDEVKL